MSIEIEQYRERRPEGPRVPSRLVKVLAVVASIVLLFGLAFGAVNWLADTVNEWLEGSDETLVAPGQPVTLEIAPGETATQIARELADAGVVASAADFERAVREERASDRLQAGVYELETGMEPEAVLDVLVAGSAGEVYRLTVVEGLTIGETLESIARQTGLGFDELSAPLLDGSVTSSLLRAEPEALREWEGLLFPDTYEFRSDATPDEILTRLAETMEDRAGGIDWSILTDRGLTPYHGIIIASLIEEEVVADDERPLVASVVFNRLDAGIPLQIDATVIYALGGAPEGGLTLDDLAIDSPYNTYEVLGLPPTPIAGPRLASLRAAAAPETTSFLYYVLTSADGTHSFTDDFDEFLQLQQQARDAGVIP